MKFITLVTLTLLVAPSTTFLRPTLSLLPRNQKSQTSTTISNPFLCPPSTTPTTTTTTTTTLSAVGPSAFLGPKVSKVLFFVFLYGLIRKAIKKGSLIAPGGTDEPNWQYVTTDEEQEKELKAFSCGECGYTIFPARGREGKFFPDDFKCPTCGSPSSEFSNIRSELDTESVDVEYENMKDYSPKIAEEMERKKEMESQAASEDEDDLEALMEEEEEDE